MSTSKNKTLKKADNTKSHKLGGVLVSMEILETYKAARQASSTALRISKALDLPIQFIEKGKLVEVKGTERKKTIKTIQPVGSKMNLKKGDKIWLKPKG